MVTGQPFDTIKTKLQTYPTQFTSPIQAFVRTFRHEGFLGMYAGCAPAAVSNIAENAVLFLCYNMCQRAVQWTVGANSPRELTVLQQAGAGSLASVFSSVAITPPDRIKCILQTQLQTQKASHQSGKFTSSSHTSNSSSRTGSWSIVRRIVRQEGFFGLFRGLTSTWVREVPGYFFFFGSYHASRRLLLPEEESFSSASS